MRFSTVLTLAVSALPLALGAPTPQEDVAPPPEALAILEAAEAQAVEDAQAAGYSPEIPAPFEKRIIKISACTVLEIAFSSRTYFPGSAEYDAENTSMTTFRCQLQ
jgi:hypothetical protein